MLMLLAKPQMADSILGAGAANTKASILHRVLLAMVSRGCRGNFKIGNSRKQAAHIWSKIQEHAGTLDKDYIFK